MQAIIRDLTSNLEAQLEGYKRVLAMAEDEKKSLVSRRPQDVLNIVQAKESEIVALRGLEQARRLLTMRAARRLQLARPEIGTRELLARTAQDPELREVSDGLARVSSELRVLLEKISRVNDSINTLCESGLSTVEYLARGLARERSAPEAMPYGRKPGVAPKAGYTGGAIRTQG